MKRTERRSPADSSPQGQGAVHERCPALCRWTRSPGCRNPRPPCETTARSVTRPAAYVSRINGVSAMRGPRCRRSRCPRWNRRGCLCSANRCPGCAPAVPGPLAPVSPRTTCPGSTLPPAQAWLRRRCRGQGGQRRFLLSARSRLLTGDRGGPAHEAQNGRGPPAKVSQGCHGRSLVVRLRA